MTDETAPKPGDTVDRYGAPAPDVQAQPSPFDTIREALTNPRTVPTSPALAALTKVEHQLTVAYASLERTNESYLAAETALAKHREASDITIRKMGEALDRAQQKVRDQEGQFTNPYRSDLDRAVAAEQRANALADEVERLREELRYYAGPKVEANIARAALDRQEQPNPIDTIREALAYPIDVPVALAALNLLDEHFAAETGKSYDQGFASGIKENARRREAAETALAEANRSWALRLKYGNDCEDALEAAETALAEANREMEELRADKFVWKPGDLVQGVLNDSTQQYRTQDEWRGLVEAAERRANDLQTELDAANGRFEKALNLQLEARAQANALADALIALWEGAEHDHARHGMALILQQDLGYELGYDSRDPSGAVPTAEVVRAALDRHTQEKENG